METRHCDRNSYKSAARFPRGLRIRRLVVSHVLYGVFILYMRTRDLCTSSQFRQGQSSIIVAPGHRGTSNDSAEYAELLLIQYYLYYIRYISTTATTTTIPQVAKYQLQSARSINRFSIGRELDRIWSGVTNRNYIAAAL